MTAASQPASHASLDRTSFLTPGRAPARALCSRFSPRLALRLSSLSVPQRTRTQSCGWISRRELAGTREAATTTTAGNASRRGTTAVATRTVRTTVRGPPPSPRTGQTRATRLTDTFLSRYSAQAQAVHLAGRTGRSPSSRQRRTRSSGRLLRQATTASARGQARNSCLAH